MKALIFPFQQAQKLAPLRYISPDFLLPLAGKPIVEHLVELLVSSGITDITLLCEDRPEEVVRHFGNGERWGSSISVSAVREGGILRMAQAALHGVEGLVLCLPGNPLLSMELFNAVTCCASRGETCNNPGTVSCGLLATEAGILKELFGEAAEGSLEELAALAVSRGVMATPHEDPLIIDLNGYIHAQRGALEGRPAWIRIPATRTADSLWIADHVKISSSTVLVPPVFIGSHTQISGAGQIGPNAVISSYSLMNNSDLICDTLVMSGTVTGPHIEMNSMAARGGNMVNLRTGATVTSPDAFILGDVGGVGEQTSGDTGAYLMAAFMMIVLFPFALPLFIISFAASTLVKSEVRLGNRRLKTLTGGNPRLPFKLRQFTIGPLLLRRWPGLFAVLKGDLALVGASAPHAEETIQLEGESLFGLDAPCGLFHIWEVEGDLPESLEEQHARENFHAVTRTFGTDLSIVLRAAIISPPASY